MISVDVCRCFWMPVDVCGCLEMSGMPGMSGDIWRVFSEQKFHKCVWNAVVTHNGGRGDP